MSSKRRITIIAAIAVSAFFLGQVAAQDQEPAGDHKTPPWMQTTQQHKDMAASVGTWDVKGEMYNAPGQPPMKFSGTAVRRMVLGGNYLAEVFKGAEFPFEGHLLQGYDTVRKEFVSIWADSSSPVMSVSRGTQGEDGKVVMFSEEPDLGSGKLVKMKSVIEPHKGGMTMTAYKVTDKGETISMKLVYTRRKQD